MATTSPYSPPAPPAAPSRMPTPEQVLRRDRAVAVGLLTALGNFAFVVADWLTEPNPLDLVIGILIAGLTVVLTRGLQRWSRAAAVSLLLLVMVNGILSVMDRGGGVGLFGMIALYLLWDGVNATMSWHIRKNRPFDPEEDRAALPRESEGPLRQEEGIRKVLGFRPPPPPA